MCKTGPTIAASCADLGDSRPEHVRAPEGVATLEQNAFRHCCENLKTFSGPGITHVGRYAFYQCGAVEAVDLPKVVEVGDRAFFQARGLERMHACPAASVVVVAAAHVSP